LIDEKKLSYDRIRGIPHIREPGNSVRRYTGAWRIFKPVWDYSKCIRCKQCWLMCPDTAIDWKNNKPVWRERVCKGCMICYEVCPAKAITKERDLHDKK